ncbi:hypothetical protein AGMMS49525_05580 [Bacteroidia bacterium]|nr:hypothetical protein AGMMS49525_05580 [Bacteroidia bacterium]
MLAALLLLTYSSTRAQSTTTLPNLSPTLAISSNLLYDATTSMNFGLELRVSETWTLKLPVTYNPWELKDNKKFKFLLVQPEIRKWLCEPFAGHYFGLHAHYGLLNMSKLTELDGVNFSGINFSYLKDHRYEGYLFGAGLSYGYNFYLAPRWNLEANIGLGYARLEYDRYECQECGKKEKTGSADYFGPTQVGLSLIYIIK